MTLTRIVMIRHGESQATVNKILGGPRSCTGLSDLGRLQAQRLRDRLSQSGEIAADVLYSSAYPRARETAEILRQSFGGMNVTIDPDFGEHDPGPECDGLSYDEFVRRHGRPDWGGDPNVEYFPGGETIAAFHTRVGKSFDALSRKHAGQTIVVACHGGVVDAVLRRTLGTPATGKFEIHTKNCSLTEFVEIRGGHWALLRYNDSAHLRDLPVATVLD
jgi:probable phosphoglycerate mutase